MNTTELYNLINGIPSLPKCKDFMLLGVVKGNEYSCPKCGKQEDEYDINEGYDVDGEHYPQQFNESRGSTIDGNYWYWDEVHCCTKCKIKYWFNNGAY